MSQNKISKFQKMEKPAIFLTLSTRQLDRTPSASGGHQRPVGALGFTPYPVDVHQAQIKKRH